MTYEEKYNAVVKTYIENSSSDITHFSFTPGSNFMDCSVEQIVEALEYFNNSESIHNPPKTGREKSCLHSS